MANTIRETVNSLHPPEKVMVSSHHSTHTCEVPFDEQHVLHELKHYLPTQTPLKDFIHHNSLHAFQHLKFYDAVYRASKIFGYQVTLELADYRKLYSIGRIKNEILDQIIVQKKGSPFLAKWKSKLLTAEYKESNSPRI